MDELERLRRWKTEATQVLDEWEVCYDVLAAAGHPAPVGAVRARHVADYLRGVFARAKAMGYGPDMPNNDPEFIQGGL